MAEALTDAQVPQRALYILHETRCGDGGGRRAGGATPSEPAPLQDVQLQATTLFVEGSIAQSSSARTTVSSFSPPSATARGGPIRAPCRPKRVYQDPTV
eukprot:CAMPEP_0198590384 /NCGR_PEP_ID=MMETSP1462-20131121/135613_1 /TAXON_ID=1333877 /ORGANISM="Brandtodinium nutriculum, Strain RCC3387" /LENGTH=98 /DNA_ID=CAMNT_0044321919 /DNA_START=142 /DNA_END=437 /DNA_ORIENTATION=-